MGRDEMGGTGIVQSSDHGAALPRGVAAIEGESYPLLDVK
jgi:hypothetical protein